MVVGQPPTAAMRHARAPQDPNNRGPHDVLPVALTMQGNANIR